MQTQQAKGAAKALFTHPFDVPVDVALAIHAIMHNKAGAETWELFDFYIREQGRNWLIECIRRTLVANGVSNIEEELEWWGQRASRLIDDDDDDRIGLRYKDVVPGDMFVSEKAKRVLLIISVEPLDSDPDMVITEDIGYSRIVYLSGSALDEILVPRDKRLPDSLTFIGMGERT